MDLAEFAAYMRERLDSQDHRLEQIHEQTVKTNGRVTSLELWQATLRGAAKGGRAAWLVAAALGGALMAALTALPQLRELLK